MMPTRRVRWMDHSGIQEQGTEPSVSFGWTGTAADLTDAAVFLATDEAGYIVSRCLNLDGGQWMS